MPNSPLLILLAAALAALLTQPAVTSERLGHKLVLAPPADAAIRVAQFQVLDTEAEEGVTPEAGEAQDSISVLDAEVEAFAWHARKDGQSIVFSGFVPSAATQSLLAVTTSGDIEDNTHIGTSAPDGFLVDALTGLDALAELESGSLRYEDDAWLLSGQLPLGEGVDAIEGILELAATPRDAWTLELASTQIEDDAPVSDIEASPDVAADASGMPADNADARPADTTEETETAQAEAQGEASGPADEATDTDDASATEMQPAEVDGKGELNHTIQAAEDTAAAPEAAPVIAGPDPEYLFSAFKGSDGALTMRGDVPDHATQALVMRLADGTGRGGLEVNPRAPQDFVSGLYAGLAALEHLEEGRLAFADGNWHFSGRAGIDTRKDEALAVLARLGGEHQFETAITAPPASAVCQEEVTAFMADKSILFGSGSAVLTPESSDLLPELAQRLNICPQTTVYVEGHTDSDGGEALNLPLSVARAEAVVDELITLGVSAQRLYAVGYGSSLPIASNDTVQGKRQNRRIAFTFEDTAQ